MLIKDPEMKGYSKGALAYGEHYENWANSFIENGFEFDTYPVLDISNGIIEDIEEVIKVDGLDNKTKVKLIESLVTRWDGTCHVANVRYVGEEEKFLKNLRNINEHLDEEDWFEREFETNEMVVDAWVDPRPVWLYYESGEGFLTEVDFNISNFGYNTTYKRAIRIMEDANGVMYYKLDYYD